VSELFYLNIPAHSCSPGVSEEGRRFVLYQGEEYAVIGMYFARTHGRNGKRTLFYILRPFTGDEQPSFLLREWASWVSDLRSRRKSTTIVKRGSI